MEQNTWWQDGTGLFGPLTHEGQVVMRVLRHYPCGTGLAQTEAFVPVDLLVDMLLDHPDGAAAVLRAIGKRLAR